MQTNFRKMRLQIIGINPFLHGAKYRASIAVPLSNEVHVSGSKLLLRHISINHVLGVVTT